MTVPKLELMGAVLELRLAESVIVVLGIPMQDLLFYSDSIDVLWWIRGRDKEFRPFVANRVGESHRSDNMYRHTRTRRIFVQEEQVLRKWPRTRCGGKDQHGLRKRKINGHEWSLIIARTNFLREGGGVVSAVNTQRDEGTSQPKGDKTWNQLYRKRGNMRRYIYKQLYYGKTISSLDALRPLFSFSFFNFICRRRPEVLNRGHVKQRGLNRFFTALYRFAAIPHC